MLRIRIRWIRNILEKYQLKPTKKHCFSHKAQMSILIKKTWTSLNGLLVSIKIKNKKIFHLFQKSVNLEEMLGPGSSFGSIIIRARIITKFILRFYAITVQLSTSRQIVSNNWKSEKSYFHWFSCFLFSLHLIRCPVWCAFC